MIPQYQSLYANNTYGSGGGSVGVAPTITSSSTFNAPENQTAIGTVTATGDAPITFSLVGGVDQAKFSVDTNTGVLTFLAAPNYEVPTDAGGDNVYNVTVRASNAAGTADQGIAVTVTDVLEPPLPSPLAWWKYNTGITVTGAGVSQWADQSGNGRHLLQATDTNRPAKQAGGEILFDGADNYLKTNAFTLNQPCTIFLLLKQVSYVVSGFKSVMTGNTGTQVNIYQGTVEGTLQLYAGSFGVTQIAQGTGTYNVITAVLNDDSSSIQVDNGTANTGDGGPNNLGGFTLGAAGDATAFSNIEVKEILIYSGALSAGDRTTVFNYLDAI